MTEPIELEFTVACSPEHAFGDRSVATEVDIRFAGEGGTTTVTIVHRGWEHLGAAGPELRRRNREGWDGVVPPYRRACIDHP